MPDSAAKLALEDPLGARRFATRPRAGDWSPRTHESAILSRRKAQAEHAQQFRAKWSARLVAARERAKSTGRRHFFV
jgi:hypothetical protein